VRYSTSISVTASNYNDFDFYAIILVVFIIFLENR